MWTIAGALSVICFFVSAPGQSLIRNLTEQTPSVSMLEVVMPVIELS